MAIAEPPKDTHGWTEERRQAQADRTKLQHEARRAHSVQAPPNVEAIMQGATPEGYRPVPLDEIPSAAPTPQVEQDVDPNAVTEMEAILLAMGSNPTITTTQVMHAEDDTVTTNASGVAVTQVGIRRVYLYKPTGECRLVPAATEADLRRLTDKNDGRWTLRCPRCGTDCRGASWGCGKVEEPQYYQCPVPQCNIETHGPKKFYVRPLPLTVRVHDAKRLTDDHFDSNTAVDLAKSEMYAHLWAFHPNYAAATNVPRAEQS